MRHWPSRLLVAFALIAALLAPAIPARAQVTLTLTVNTLVDEWSTGPNAAQSKCSLREALQATVTNSPLGNQGCGPVGTGGFSSYRFDMKPGTYLLTLPDQLPNVLTGKRIRIDGNNAVKIDGNRSAARFEGIFIVGGGELILERLTLQHGRRPFGGALWIKSGIARATKVEFLRNIAFSDITVGDGGAVHLDAGQLHCLECRFIENKAAGNGGAVRTGNTTVVLDKSEFLRNEAQFYGGAVAGFGGSDVTRPHIIRSLFRENRVFRTNVPATWPAQYTYNDDASGGGTIYNAGSMLIEQSQIVKSTTERSRGGGAIYNQGTLRLVDVAISSSQAIAGGPVPATIGGAIFNGAPGTLTALRVSLHDNEATRGGAIMNGAGSTLYLVNSTVAQNRAEEAAGLSNGYELTQNGSLVTNNGGEAYVYLSTLVRNDDSAKKGNLVDIGNPGTIYLGNSITDAGCTGLIYTYGGNTFVGLNPCNTFAPAGGSDTVKPLTSQLKLGGLEDNGGASLPVARFLSVKPEDASPAVDLGRAEYCTGLAADLLATTDQIGTQRPQGEKCDAGALEVGVNPPEWEANPTEDAPLVFPLIFADQATASDREIEIGNKGGGKIKWEASLTRNDGGVFALTSEANNGSLGKDDKETVALRCIPGSDDTFYGSLTFKIDQPEEKEIVYTLVCSRRSNADEPAATPKDEPGPKSVGQTPPGSTTQRTLTVLNQGTKPLTFDVSWANPALNTLSVSPLGAVSVAAGGLLSITISCTPDGPGLLSNTLNLVTSDPLQPQLSYPVACEGGPNPDPDPVRNASTNNDLSSMIMGLAISPDGTQVLAGRWTSTAANAGIMRYSRSPNGLLSLQSPTPFSVPDMTGISGLRYARDGRHVYYSSLNGDGVGVATTGAGGSLTATQTITRTTPIVFCGFESFNPPIAKFCPSNTMDGARALDLTADDLNLYVTGYNDDSLTVFRRDPTTGQLAYMQALTGTFDEVAVLDGAFGVLVSPDGKNVYVAAQNSNAVTAFLRRADTGMLSYLGHVVFSTTVAPGGPTELALSPDGRFLYVADTQTDSIHILARSSGDGFLTFKASLALGSASADPYHILISPEPEGARLTVALWNGDAIKVYRRDLETGLLTPLADQPEVTPNGPVFLVGAPDGRDVYASLFDGMGVLQMRVQRPVPAALSLAPASVVAGSCVTTLTVRGQGFAPDSQILWQGTPLATTYLSANRLEAAVPAGLLANVGNASVVVRTPPGGGGDSAALTVVIQAAAALPIPAISGISPEEAAYGGAPLTITVSGSGFTSQSQVLLNGLPVATTYLNEATLLAELGAGQAGSPGPLALSVVNGAATTGASLAATTTTAPVRFAVAAPGLPAAPAITSFSPASLVAGSGEQWITVRGFNFARQQGSSTFATWGGEPRETIVLDAETLQVRVSAADVALVGTGDLMLITPGVGTSALSALPTLAPDANPVAVPETLAVELGGATRLIVSGEEFVAGAEVEFNGVKLITTFVNRAVLSAEITSGQLRLGGTVRVLNPSAAPSRSLTLTALPTLWLPAIRR
ncbi:MAG: beta-propeller fold lactonase family protein [Oscillochloridaceae bacterium umkhey_bin13]